MALTTQDLENIRLLIHNEMEQLKDDVQQHKHILFGPGPGMDDGLLQDVEVLKKWRWQILGFFTGISLLIQLVPTIIKMIWK